MIAVCVTALPEARTLRYGTAPVPHDEATGAVLGSTIESADHTLKRNSTEFRHGPTPGVDVSQCGATPDSPSGFTMIRHGVSSPQRSVSSSARNPNFS